MALPGPGPRRRPPSVTVRVDRRGIERWRCWSGGHGGTAIDAIYHAHSVGYREAHRGARPRVGVAPTSPTSGASAARSRRASRCRCTRRRVRYVEACERLLWKPIGRPVLDYLTDERGLDPDVLRVNRVGADPGTGKLRRAGGLPKDGPGAVFPALDVDGRITYFQTRYLDPKPNRSKYGNPASRLGDNPRHGWTRPLGPAKQPVVICEGFPDAYTANSAGYDAVAVLGAANATPAPRRTPRAGDSADGRSILALDGDDAGRHAAEQHLRDRCRARGIMVIELPPSVRNRPQQLGAPARSLPDVGRPRPPTICRPDPAPAVVVPAP